MTLLWELRGLIVAVVACSPCLFFGLRARRLQRQIRETRERLAASVEFRMIEAPQPPPDQGPYRTPQLVGPRAEELTRLPTACPVCGACITDLDFCREYLEGPGLNRGDRYSESVRYECGAQVWIRAGSAPPVVTAENIHCTTKNPKCLVCERSVDNKTDKFCTNTDCAVRWAREHA